MIGFVNVMVSSVGWRWAAAEYEAPPTHRHCRDAADSQRTLSGLSARSRAPQSVEMAAGRGIVHAGLFPRGW
ncbi:MAG: hypothetical protein E6I80_10960 [Chloroflexi bacterium]|nr:MAG: hypothetical protein E6I80_10960 [Chloroflexota bacterium]